MSKQLRNAHLGFSIDRKYSLIRLEEVPGAEPFSIAAAIGSQAVNSLTGKTYTKETAGSGTDKWAEDPTVAYVDTALSTGLATKVSLSGDTMDAGADLAFGGGGEVTGLPSVPLTSSSASSKSYTDAVAADARWIEGVWYINLISDVVGNGQSGVTLVCDLQTPANDDPDVAGAEDSDLFIIGSTAASITLRAVGVTGNISDTAVIQPGEVVRFDADIINGSVDPFWEVKGHITTFEDRRHSILESTVKTRWGISVLSSVAGKGTFAGLDDFIMSLVDEDPDGTGTADYDALWGIDSNSDGAREQSRIETVDDVAGSLGGTHFTLAAAVGNGGVFNTPFYVWFNTGASSDPAPGGTGIEVPITADDTAAVVAAAVKTAVDTFHKAAYWTLDVSTERVTITNNFYGNVTDAVAGTSGFSVTVLQQGAAGAAPMEGKVFYVPNEDDFNYGRQFTYIDSQGWREIGDAVCITAGDGLVLSVSSIGYLVPSELAIDVRPNSGLWLTEDGVASSEETDAKLAIKLDGSSLSMGALGLRVNFTSVLTVVNYGAEDKTLILVNSTDQAVEIQLPDAADYIGEHFHIKWWKGYNSVTMAAQAGQTVDEEESHVFGEQMDSLHVVGVSATEWALI